MKLRIVHPLLLACLAGCAVTPPPETKHGTREMWVGDALRAASMHRAIITQRTLYPYHFEIGLPELNSLGERDLAILAEHFGEHGGEINLQRGDASFELYSERNQAVRTALTEAGVAEDRIAIVDGLPGGSGVSGMRVLEILAPEAAGEGDAMMAGAAVGGAR